MARPTQREIADSKRRDKLLDVERQLAEGSLQIRTMTPAERELWGPAVPARSKPRLAHAPARRPASDARRRGDSTTL